VFHHREENTGKKHHREKIPSNHRNASSEMNRADMIEEMKRKGRGKRGEVRGWKKKVRVPLKPSAGVFQTEGKEKPSGGN